VQKISKRGKVFYGCSLYPQCSFALWDKPVALKCPQCGNPYLLEKQNKNHAPRLQCPNKSCNYSAAPAAEDHYS
jgi:DNA topoisomerase-1